MREIKFRVWDSAKNRWNEDGTGYTKNSRVYAYDTEGIGINELITLAKSGGYILCQYTGLKDKNGVEIYEGDIWQFKDERGRRFGKVVYQHGMFIVHTNQLGNKLIETWNGHNMPHGEVIGNIYENPELLDDGVKVDE